MKPLTIKLTMNAESEGIVSLTINDSEQSKATIAIFVNENPVGVTIGYNQITDIEEGDMIDAVFKALNKISEKYDVDTIGEIYEHVDHVMTE